MAEPITSVECRNIKKNFGGVQALTGVNLRVEKGEIRALFGGNGSGKSTLAKILGGVVSLDSGEVFINQEKTSITSPIDADRHGIVVTSQELSMFYNISVHSNVMLGSINRLARNFLDRNEIRQKANAVLEALEHLDIAEEDLGSLPDNTKYIVEFAKALQRNPKILIIDEVTSALYSQEFEIVKKTIFELKEKGIPVIFISHRMNEVFSICNTITVLRNGKDVLTDELKNVSKEKLLELMTGHVALNSGAVALGHAAHAAPTAAAGDDRDLALTAKNIHIPIFDTKLDITVKKSEFVGISGLQGQGQSYIVRSLFGLAGAVRLSIHGREIEVAAPIDAIRSGIGFISGNREAEGVFAERPIYENIDAIHNYILKRGRVNYSEALSKFDIKIGTLNDPIRSLSGGNQQKTVIARWMSTQPKLLLADDPNKGVDVQARRDVHAIIKDLVDSGSSVLMVSSDDEELADIASLIEGARVLIMYRGEIIKTLIGGEVTVPNIIHYSVSKGA